MNPSSAKIKNKTLARIMLLACWMATFLIVTPVLAQQQLGHDLPFVWHEDETASADLNTFLRLPPSALTHSERPVSLGYTRSALWIKTFIPATALSDNGNWLTIGPNFIDDIAVYIRQHGSEGPWIRKDAGDRWPGSRSDLNYRNTIFALPELAPASAGLDLVIRAESTSAVLIKAALLDDRALFARTTRSTGFWSFYFGLAAISVCLAILLAIAINQRFLWAISAFSLTYVLVASLEGFISWVVHPWIPDLQHYVTSFLSLVSFATLLWLWAEAMDLSRRWPSLYRANLAIAIAIVALTALIPLNLYAVAINLRTALFLIGALTLLAGAVVLWVRAKLRGGALVLGLIPLGYVAAGVAAQMALSGTIPYFEEIYVIWQYLLVLNVILVLALAVIRVRHESRETQSKKLLAHELRVEREASFHQRQFLGLVAHEFRTPLSIISSAVQNLRYPTLTEAQREERYNKIQRAALRLTQLTDNCLADSRLSATTLYVEKHQVDALELVRTTIVNVDTQGGYQIELTVNHQKASRTPHPHLPPITADAALLRITLSNLIDNALKYSPPGTITIDVSVTDTLFRLEVADTGPGIPPDQLEFIFQRYRRIDGNGRRNSGTGLGLYVAREIAKAHGGTLTVQPNQPSGCRFLLEIPVTPAETKAASHE